MLAYVMTVLEARTDWNPQIREVRARLRQWDGHYNRGTRSPGIRGLAYSIPELVADHFNMTVSSDRHLFRIRNKPWDMERAVPDTEIVKELECRYEQERERARWLDKYPPGCAYYD